MIYIITDAGVYDKEEQSFYRLDDLFQPAVKSVQRDDFDKHKAVLPHLSLVVLWYVWLAFWARICYNNHMTPWREESFVATNQACDINKNREIIEKIEKIYEEGEVIYIITDAGVIVCHC